MIQAGIYVARVARRALPLIGLVAAMAGAAGSTSIAGERRGAYEAMHAVAPAETLAPIAAQGATTAGVRVATWNIHSGLGASFSLWQSRASVERNLNEIARDIAGAWPAGQPVDVVALNEVDFGSRRSAWIDEAAYIAGALEERTGERYDIVRGQTWQRSAYGREVSFGNALLVRLPLVSASECLLSALDCGKAPGNEDLPSLTPSGLRGLVSEERGVVKATVLAGGRPLDVVVTHLDAFSEEMRERQAMHVLRRFVDPSRSTVLLGDLNAVTASNCGKRPFFRDERTVEILTSGSLADARATYASIHGASPSWATYPAEAPVWPLDAVLASTDLLPMELSVLGSTASDHRGLAAMFVPAAPAGVATSPSPATAGSTAS